MKKLTVTALASIVSLAAIAQGTIQFGNISTTAGINAPVTLSDGVTKLSGSTYQAQLWAGPTAGSMVAQGNPASFLTGGGAGYISGGVVTLTGVAGGAVADCVVIVWDTTLGGTTTGATESAAMSYWMSGHANVWGESGMNYLAGTTSPLSITTGNPGGSPPTTPAFLTGLQPFSLAPVVPEPTSLALIGLGGAAAMFFRRRK